MMKHRFARLVLVLGLPSLAAAGACSGSSTLPPTSGDDGTGGGSTAAGGFPPGQGGVPGSSGSGSGATPSSGGTTASFGGFPSTFGGYPTTTTGGVPGGSTGGVSSGGGALNVTAGGYVDGGSYKGYAWTATESPSKGSTITPANFETVTSASQLCVSGSVAADAAYGGVAMLGVNLNQPSTGGTGSEGTYTPPPGGNVTVSVTNTGGSTLRVQIQAPGGDTNENLRWCATLSGSGGTIALSSFNTHCWDNSGQAYAGQALQSVMILVPGGNATATSFNFCLNSLSI